MFCLLSYHCITFEKTLTVSSLCPTLKQQKTAVRSPFTLLLFSSEEPQLSQPFIVLHVLQPFTILVALHWTCSSLPMSFSCRGAPDCMQHSRWVSQVPNKKEGWLPSTSRLQSCQCHPRRSSLLPGHTAGSVYNHFEIKFF